MSFENSYCRNFKENMHSGLIGEHYLFNQKVPEQTTLLFCGLRSVGEIIWNCLYNLSNYVFKQKLYTTLELNLQLKIYKVEIEHLKSKKNNNARFTTVPLSNQYCGNYCHFSRFKQKNLFLLIPINIPAVEIQQRNHI